MFEKRGAAMFYIEMMRAKDGEVWATLRDGPSPATDDLLRDEVGVIWRVVGHTPSEVKLKRACPVPEGEEDEPTGSVLVVSCPASAVSLKSASVG